MAFARRWALACAARALIGPAGLEAVLSPVPAHGRTAVASGPPMPAPAFYVEFRAAEIGLYGHSYIAFGRLDPDGEPASVQYADFHPKRGMLGLAVGHIVPVPADTAPEEKTLTLPVTSAFLRPLTAAEYDKVLETIERVRADNRAWSLFAYNCNTFAGEVAESIGMKTPRTSVVFSTVYIPALRFLNNAPAGSK